MQPSKMPSRTQSIAFLIANITGAILYVFAASRGGWAIPEERAAGINTTTGEPFIWFLSVVPVVAVFMVINVAWTIILSRRHWSGRSYWLLGAVVWLAAIAIDFAHH
jgi:TRAP-type C4-dicarboxylate transport system permease small subunit